MKHIKILLCALVFASLAVSCKKDEEASTSKSFSGTISLGCSIPAYVLNGEVYHITPSGVSKTEDDQTNDPRIGYYFSVTQRGSVDTTRTYSNENDNRTGEFDFLVPLADTLGSVTLTVSAYATGYYSTSTSSTMVIVSPEINSGSLKNFSTYSTDNTFTDPRDNNTYLCTEVGSVVWMRQNLAYAEVGKSYQNCNAMQKIFGGYYTWEEAKNACPTGWRIPTKADWEALESSVSGNAGALMDDVYFNEDKMWEFFREVSISNTSHLSAIPAGYAIVGDGSTSFKGINKYASFWMDDAGHGYNKYIYVQSPAIFVQDPSQTDFAASVRCVKDK